MNVLNGAGNTLNSIRAFGVERVVRWLVCSQLATAEMKEEFAPV